MGTLSLVCLGVVTVVHLAFGISAYFQAGVYNVDSWMVDGKPGTGNTPIEQLLGLIFSLWYLASIIPVTLCYLSGSSNGLKVAILTPFFYHFLISVCGFMFLDKIGVCNEELISGYKIGGIHAILATACLMIYMSE